MSQREVSCVDKLVFETREAAEGAKIYAYHQHGTKLKAYQCKECALWHLSSV